MTCVALAASACGGDAAAPPIEIWEPPPNPHLADSAWAIFHHDSYAQHHSPLPAVTGAGAVSLEVLPLDGIPIFVLFDPDEQILTVAKGINGATLWKIDRQSLTPLASVDLAAAAGVFSATYGYVDAQGRAVLGMARKVLRYRSVTAPDALELDGEADLAGVLADGDNLVAISALYSGEIAFLSANGVLGVLPADLSAPLDVEQLPDDFVSNGFSVDEDGGIYIVTRENLLRASWDGAALSVAWSTPVEAPYTSPRPGRLGVGSGTTPVLMRDGYVAIADDAERMNLMLVERATGNVTCKVPIFDEPSTTDNAIIVAGRSMIIDQNLLGGRGVARYDLTDSGTCERIWIADVLAPTCVPTLSTATGLVYVYTEDAGDFALTGLDAQTGDIAFTVPTGTGPYNNYYSAVTIGPDSRVYVGALIGLLVFADEP
jgi:hypothetical protein